MSPIISGGGGGGPAAGSYVPVADTSGVTVNTTTYDDVLSGSGKMATLVFPGIQSALAFAIAGDAFPRLVIGSRPQDGIYFGNGTIEPTQNGANLYLSGVSGVSLSSQGTGSTNLFAGSAGVQTDPPINTISPARLNSLSPKLTITSGALPTVALVSGTGAQILTTRDAETVTPFTGDATNNAATCVIALSPDNVTYSTLDTLSIAAAINLTGALALNACVRVPAGWYLKLTATHGTLGTTTYY